MPLTLAAKEIQIMPPTRRTYKYLLAGQDTRIMEQVYLIRIPVNLF